MMTIQKMAPSLALREYVRCFELRDIVMEGRIALRPLPPRKQLLLFHLRDRPEIIDCHSGQKFLTPSAAILVQTYRAIDVLWKGQFLVFVVSFQPTGIHRLLGLPMPELTGRCHDASDVIGGDVQFLHERLHQSASFGEMVRAAECFLLDKLAVAQPFHPVQAAAVHVLTRHGQVHLDRVVSMSGLSQRQFERKFTEQVGTTPKLYARVNRLNYALRLKEKSPELTWTHVTYQAGYFDQTHFVKDCKSLTGETPSDFLRRMSDFYYPAGSCTK